MADPFISTIVTATQYRLFPNFFDVSIKSSAPSSNSNIVELNKAYGKISKCCFSADFGGDFSFDFDYNENTKQHFIRKANLIKTVTLTFYELADMSCVRAFKADFDSIYDSKRKVFKKDAFPSREITIVIDTPAVINGITLEATVIKMKGAKLQTYKYPKLSWKDKEPIETPATYSFDSIDIESLRGDVGAPPSGNLYASTRNLAGEYNGNN